MPTRTVTATGTVTATSTVAATGTTTGTVTGTTTGTPQATNTVVATGTAQASATPQGGKVTICHRTGSQNNPYVQITISEGDIPDHEGHGDIIPAPPEGCPAGPTREPRPTRTPRF